MGCRRRRRTNVGHSDVNLSPLVLPCSRITLVQGGVYCLHCGEWAFVGIHALHKNECFPPLKGRCHEHVPTCIRCMFTTPIEGEGKGG